MTLQLQQGTNKPLTFTLTRWNKQGNNLTASVTPPLGAFPVVGQSYTLSLLSGADTDWTGAYTYQDYIYQGYTDPAGKDVTSISDMNFTVTPVATAPS